MRDSAAYSASSPRRSRTPLAKLTDQELMELRLKDLDVSIAGTWVEECVRDLNAELRARQIAVRPHAWISDEWFSPDNTAGISIPFYLVDPRLKRLERKMMLEVEGGTRRECMRILRHEAGHVIQHAFALHRRKRWQSLFGRSSVPYPDFYKPDPASREHVQHLRRWYAQAHPDEDFAETFAVWLTPRANWRKRYADWPALEKIEYVDELMREIAGRRPLLVNRIEVDPVSRLNKTLGEHYKKKLEHYSVGAPTTFDHDLHRIFSDEPRHRNSPSASAFIRRNRAEIRRLASKRTGEHPVTVETVLDDMIARCRALNLRAPGAEAQLRRSLTALLTDKAVHSFYTASRRQWFAV
jgi:hypothetical protein